MAAAESGKDGERPEETNTITKARAKLEMGKEAGSLKFVGMS